MGAWKWTGLGESSLLWTVVCILKSAAQQFKLNSCGCEPPYQKLRKTDQPRIHASEPSVRACVRCECCESRQARRRGAVRGRVVRCMGLVHMQLDVRLRRCSKCTVVEYMLFGTSFGCRW